MDESVDGGADRLCFQVAFAAGPIRAARRSVEDFASARGFVESQVRDLALAVTEALFNAAEHGQEGCREVFVELNFEAGVGLLEVAVEDDAGGCDSPQRLAERIAELERLLRRDDPDLSPDPDLERGRGLYLIRERSDGVRIERGARGGVRLVMVKRR